MIMLMLILALPVFGWLGVRVDFDLRLELLELDDILKMCCVVAGVNKTILYQTWWFRYINIIYIYQSIDGRIDEWWKDRWMKKPALYLCNQSIQSRVVSCRVVSWITITHKKYTTHFFNLEFPFTSVLWLWWKVRVIEFNSMRLGWISLTVLFWMNL